MNKVEVGVVTKPQGLNGAFRIKILDIYKDVFAQLKAVEIQDKLYNIKKLIDRGGFFIVQTDQIKSIEKAEQLRNKSVYAMLGAKQIIKLNNNLYYSVYINENLVGKIIEVNNYGATDIYTLDNGKMIAVVPNLILNVNDENMQLQIDENVYNEVAL